MPVLFVPHGGGPLPLMGDPDHHELTLFLQSVALGLPRPKAIVVITAHWEEDCVAISNGDRPGMVYDYYGFPAEAYQYQYPAAGSPELAKTVAGLLDKHGIAAKLDSKRGFDHGTFVPLMLMYPLADIPVLQLSLVNTLNPAGHIAVGRALSALREQGVLILGSGMSFHNMQALFSLNPAIGQKSAVFDDWLSATLMSHQFNVDRQTDRLTQWAQAPEGRFCHPREEHLLPLHVCFGAGAGSATKATKAFAGRLGNISISAFLWA
ncbi:MAG: class III extradiol ring-cleavage dioxygenase [Methylococcaceae bacterium]